MQTLQTQHPQQQQQENFQSSLWFYLSIKVTHLF